MKSFNNIHFKGNFRDYQQRVLDNADKYLKDGKINIVAAPGSGKTVLGLEPELFLVTLSVTNFRVRLVDILFRI